MVASSVGKSVSPSAPKRRAIAVALALAGVAAPIAGFHKFYLGQNRWGMLYLLLSWTPMPRIACAIEALWYLAQDQQEFDRNFNGLLAAPAAATVAPEQVSAIATALRELDRLRQEGLISEAEFEQKRTALVDQLA
ncbi:MAG: NINE protein [Cyanobacteria bacterium]|nr:NINE protein [Cyanobacteriota bacterium]